MSSLHQHDSGAPEPTGDHDTGGGRRHSHGWLMIACCIPMLAIAVILVLTRVVDPVFLVVAVACTLMMALMMRGMGGEDSPRR